MNAPLPDREIGTQSPSPEPLVPDVLVSTPAMRRNWMLVFLGLVLLVCVFDFIYLPWFIRLFKHATHERNLVDMLLLPMPMVLFFILDAAYSLQNGWKIWRQKRTPLPDAWVLTDTPIKRGRVARWMGGVWITFGVLSGVIALGMLGFVFYIKYFLA